MRCVLDLGKRTPLRCDLTSCSVSPMVAEMKNALEFGETQDNRILQFRGRQSMDIATSIMVSGATASFLAPEPYEAETPSGIADREYEIYNGTIAVGSTFFNPLVLLELKSPLSDILKTFSYVRSDIRLRFVLNSTPNSWGMGIVSWIPDTVGVANLDTINGCPTPIDISAQESVQITIPFISNLEAFSPTTSVGPGVYVTWMYVASGSSDITTPTYKVYASLVNPKFFGAIAQSEGSSKGDTQYTALNTMVDMLAVGATVLVPELAVPAFAAAGMVQQVTSFLEESEQLYKRAAPGNKVDKHSMDITAVRPQVFGDLAGCHYCPSYQVASSSQERFPLDHLGEDDEGHKIISLVRLPAYTQFFEVTAAGLVTSEIYYAPWFQMTNRRMSFVDHWANLFRYWRGGIRVLIDFYTSPLISATFLVYSWNTDVAAVPLTGERENSMRRVVQVRGHTQVSLTVPYFSLHPWQQLSDAVTPPPTRLFCQRLMGPNSIGDNAGTVFVAISVAAAPDFEFRALRSPIVDKVVIPGFAVAQSLRSSFLEAAFPTLGGGDTSETPLYDLYEMHATAEDLSLRFSSRGSANVNIGLQLPIGAAPSDYDLFDFIQNSFLYVRGSYRLKNPITEASPPIQQLYMKSLITTGTTTFLPLSGNGMVVIDPRVTALREIEVPFFSTVNFLQSSLVATSHVETSEQPTMALTSSDLYVAAGRDYQLAYALPPRKPATYSVNTALP